MINSTKRQKTVLLRRTAMVALLAGAGFGAAPALAADAAETAAAPAQVGEVIVTATRREEALSKVPV